MRLSEGVYKRLSAIGTVRHVLCDRSIGSESLGRHRNANVVGTSLGSNYLLTESMRPMRARTGSDEKDIEGDGLGRETDERPERAKRATPCGVRVFA